MKLSEKAHSLTHKVIVYGAPFTGKTELVGKLALHYNLLWFDLENGYVTLSKLPLALQERIELISIPDSRAFPIAVETLLKVVKGTEVKVCEVHGKVGCPICKKEGNPEVRICLNEVGPDTIVVIDSLTQFTASGISHITKTQPDDYKMDFGDWGQLAVIVDKLLSQIQAARYNLVCISHELEVKMEDGKVKLVPVCGSSQSSRNTAKYFDHAVYAEVKNNKHIAGSSTGYKNNVVTGSRSNVEMEKSVEPNLFDIFTSWKHSGETQVHCTGHVDYAPETAIPAREPIQSSDKSPAQNAMSALERLRQQKKDKESGK